MMAASGVVKLIEEMGELNQVLGKKLAYWYTDDHPDGKSINDRLIEEIGDVLAALALVEIALDLDTVAIDERMASKVKLFFEWYYAKDNNTEGIDRENS